MIELARQAVDLFLHLDEHLRNIIETYGAWTYGILFVTIFCETGLVVTPFLPGDSLLFAAGAFAATGSLDLAVLCGLLSIAAILGDTVNYWAGHLLGPRLIREGRLPLVKPQHLEHTKRFYEKHGPKTIVLARFVPIVRTFAPFVAGVGDMTYRQFMAYNVIGGLAWVLICTVGGYLFGNIPFVKDNFELVLIAIVAISVLPAAYEWAQSRRVPIDPPPRS